MKRPVFYKPKGGCVGLSVLIMLEARRTETEVRFPVTGTLAHYSHPSTVYCKNTNTLSYTSSPPLVLLN
jgi:hypothetical protein